MTEFYTYGLGYEDAFQDGIVNVIVKKYLIFFTVFMSSLVRKCESSFLNL